MIYSDQILVHWDQVSFAPHRYRFELRWMPTARVSVADFGWMREHAEMSLKDLSLRSKLFVGFGVAALGLVIVGWRGIGAIGEIETGFQHLVEHQAESMIRVREAERDLLARSRAVSNHILATDRENQQAQEEIIDASAGQFVATLQALIAFPARTVESRQDLQAILDLGNKVAPLRAKVLELSRANQNEEALAFNRAQLAPVVEQQMKMIGALVARWRTQLDEGEAQAATTYSSARSLMLVVIALALAASIGLGFGIARGIAKSLDGIVRLAERMGAGDLSEDAEIRSRDEIGRMGQALNLAVAGMREALAAISHSAETLASSSEELAAVSQQMSSNAEETSAQAGAVSAASEQVSRNVETVAAGAEEMSASIKEIASNASEAARVAQSAVSAAETTNRDVAKLGDSSLEIGQVIKVITSIAEQTNLLALNATIEAARAGEAGKGFAVVAGEVKELAKQTAQATEDISRRIDSIQGDTQKAVQSIGQITGVIHQINDISTTIASAVEEQSATTAEIGRNVSEAAKGSAEITQNISGVAQAAQETTTGATTSHTAASDLTRLASDLQQLVGRFKFRHESASA
jgi:methyl-accepting chemotaxis protein